MNIELGPWQQWTDMVFYRLYRGVALILVSQDDHCNELMDPAGWSVGDPAHIDSDDDIVLAKGPEFGEQGQSLADAYARSQGWILNDSKANGEDDARS